MFNKAANKKAKALKTASQFLDQSTAIIAAAGNKAYKNSDQYVNQFRRNYPAYQRNAKVLANSAASYGNDALKTARRELAHFSEEAMPYIIGTEKKLLRLGFLYVVYKLFVADDKKVYETTSKVKSCIKERPVQSALVALGAGLLLGKIWR